MHVKWIPGAGLVAAVLLMAAPAGAHDESHAVAGDGLLIDTRKEPAKHKLDFKASGQAAIFPAHDPVDGATLSIRWGEGEDRNGLIRLVPAFWVGLGSPAGAGGWKYKDKTGIAGGITQVLWKAGMLKVQGRGAGLEFELPTPVQSVRIDFRVAGETTCLEFGGDINKNGDGGIFQAKNAPAPSSGCEAAVCGNGVLEAGEGCDDGNLDQGDVCLNHCVLNPCQGAPTHAGTFAAIQEKIFEHGDCTSSFCHDSSSPAANLNLTAGNSWANLVNIDASFSALDRVEPGDEALSFLYEKLAGATLGGAVSAGSSMPPGGLPAITANYLAALRLWIRDGAPATGTVPGTADLLGACLPP